MMHWQTTLTVTQVVHDLVTKAGEQLRVNEVVRRSLVPYTVHREEDLLDNIVSQVPVGRMAEPEEIAFTVAWLADERNAYTTGANIPVNGGMFMSA